jgi:hypothetical protein
MIVDNQQLLIAFPDAAAVTRKDGTTLRRLDEMADPVLAQLRMHTDAPTRMSIDVDDTRFIVMSSSLQKLVGRAWSIVLVVPEADFIGFVATNNRRSLGMFVVVICLAVMLTAVLVGRGVVAERLTRAAESRHRATNAQNIALELLARFAPAFDPDDETARRRLTEIIAQGAQADRVVLWRLDATCLTCLDAYTPSARAHVAGKQLLYADCPHLCNAMRRGEESVVRDTTEDLRLAKFFASYFVAAGTLSLLAIPIGTGSSPLAYLWIEYCASGSVVHSGYAFARTAAQMISPSFVAVRPTV